MKRFLLRLVPFSIFATVLIIPLDRAGGQIDVRCRLEYRCRSGRYLAFWDLTAPGQSASLIIHKLQKCSRSHLAKSLCAIYSIVLRSPSNSIYWHHQIKVDYQYIDQEDSLISSSTIIPRLLKPNRLYEIPLMPEEKYQSGITFTKASSGAIRYGSLQDYNRKPLELK